MPKSGFKFFPDDASACLMPATLDRRRWFQFLDATASLTTAADRQMSLEGQRKIQFKITKPAMMRPAKTQARFALDPLPTAPPALDRYTSPTS